MFSISTFAQSYSGKWYCEIMKNDTIIPIELRLTQKDGFLSGSLITPFEIQISEKNLRGSRLWIESKSNDFYFSGSLSEGGNVINGAISYMKSFLSIKLYNIDQVPYQNQHPKKPYPYKTEDITFKNYVDSTTLSGTLSLPDSIGEFPAVILIGGSRPTKKDNEMFLVLADYLTRKGVAVFRYDSRGIGKSKGSFYNSTSSDFAQDVICAKNYLLSRDDIKKQSIGLIGHSEGGVVASIAASRDSNIAFIVLLASPGLKVKEVFGNGIDMKLKLGVLTKLQYSAYRNVFNKCCNLIEKGYDITRGVDSLKLLEDAYIKAYNLIAQQNNGKDVYEYLIKSYFSPHSVFLIKCTPSVYFEKVKCPVLSLNGDKDFNVIAKENQQAIRNALQFGNNSDFQIIELEGINHAFQDCKIGTELESLEILQTFSPNAMKIINDWIQKHQR